jgi:hypothetical protein
MPAIGEASRKMANVVCRHDGAALAVIVSCLGHAVERAAMDSESDSAEDGRWIDSRVARNLESVDGYRMARHAVLPSSRLVRDFSGARPRKKTKSP